MQPEQETKSAESGEVVLKFTPAGSNKPDRVVKTTLRSVEALAVHQGWDERLTKKVQFVLDELASNIVSHGWSQELTPHIDICIVDEGDTVRIEIADDGAAFDPLTEAPPAPVHERDRPVTIGGLGVHLVKKMTRTMAYRHEGGRNHLRLTIGTE